MFRIITNRNITPARRDRVITIANRYTRNIQATSQYARDRARVGGSNNISVMANRQYSRSTYMGVRNALGGGK